MPLKFVTRNLRGNSYYHVYNQGTGEEEIFQDKQDYESFLHYLNIYTSSPMEVAARYPNLDSRLKNKNLAEEISLVAYCLMPNHFHLLLRQKAETAMPKLLKQLTNAYTTYFNSRYKRSGGLMQGRYRAALIESEFLVIQMARYIHLDPVTAGLSLTPGEYSWSSFNNRSGSNELLNRFGSVAEWEKFHADREGFTRGLEKLRAVLIEGG